MTFVCNAGPIIALAKIDQLSLLHQMANSVMIPEAVFHEVLAKPGPDSSRILSASRSFLNVAIPPGNRRSLDSVRFAPS
jgi:predicted nucleic acid-binding protein